MTKTFCDACGRESWEHSGVSLCRASFQCHLLERNGGYVDRESNLVSGRLVDVDLCSRCYNAVMGAAAEKLKIIRGGKGAEK